MNSKTGVAEKPVSYAGLFGDGSWWSFCLLILALKFFLLALDPLPKLFLGDSMSYIWTALTGWIPPDRSFFYGYVIRWSSVWTESLTSLLVLQAFVSAGTAVLLAWICRSIFELRIRLCFVLGFLGAVDPLQLVWERYVMTETFSLFFYVAGLYFSLLYLKHRRIRHLAIVHGLSVFLIAFRMSYLLVVQLNTVLLPIVAFYPLLLGAWQQRRIVRGERFWPVKLALVHLLTSIVLMFLLHGAYKQVNGRLSHREPDYLYASGLHLFAAWAPILEPSDASDPRLARIIEQGNDFGIKQLAKRNHQRWAPGYLTDRLNRVESDPTRADQIAKETALHALRRNPLQVIRLAAQTYAQYWNIKKLRSYARIDLGHVNLKPEDRSMLAQRFHFAPHGQGAPPSILQHYFIASLPYCYFVLLSPVLGFIAIYLCRQKRYPLFLVIHLGVILGTVMTFSNAPSLRYIQPASVLTLMCVALCIHAIGPLARRDAAIQS
jgi:hypothetical protein